MEKKSSEQPVKIGNMEGRKWKIIHSADKIGIELSSPDDVGDKFYMERDESESSWSFFVPSRNNTSQQDKLYVTYDKADLTLTLKTLKDIGKLLMDRHYILLHQPSGRLLMQPQASSTSYIGVKNDHLIIRNVEEGTEESLFVIGVEVSAGDIQGDSTVEIRWRGSGRWMISTDAQEDGNVMVGVSQKDSVWEWKTNSPKLIKVPEKDLYISKDCNNCNEIVFGSSTNSNSHFRRIGNFGGFKLKQKKQYVATKGGESNSEFLCLVDKENSAISWEIPVIKLDL